MDVAVCLDGFNQLINSTYLDVASQATPSLVQSALNIDRFGWAGEIGNYELCSRQGMLVHCLAGSVYSYDRTAMLAPHSGLCVPVECSPLSLQSDAVLQFISSQCSANLPFSSLTYFCKVKSIMEVTSKWQTGYTCGSYAYPSGYSFVIVIGIMVFLFAIIISLSTSCEALQQIKIFSVRDNWNVFVRSLNRDGNSIFDGLKAVSMLWIMFGHSVAILSSLGLYNPADVLPPSGFMKNVSAQLIFSSRFAVDTFFFVSGYFSFFTSVERGFLQSTFTSMGQLWHMAGSGSYSEIPSGTPSVSSEFSVSRSVLSYFLILAMRVMRILPVYLVCLVLWWKVSIRLGEGPYWYRWWLLKDRCDVYFWTNLMFLNNEIPSQASDVSGCFYVSWYLAVDMQLHLIGPVFVWMYLWRREAGVLTAISVACLCAVLGGYYALLRDWSPHAFDGKLVSLYSSEFYTKPLFRMVPFAVGVLTAMVWHCKDRPHQWPLQPKVVGMTSMAVVLSLCFLIFGSSSAYQHRPCGPYESPVESGCGSGWTVGQRALYIATSKLVWSVALSVLTLLSLDGHLSFLDLLLDSVIVKFFSRISFAMYLVHVGVINSIVFSRVQKPYFDFYEIFQLFSSVLLLSSVISVLIHVTVEIPVAILSKEFLSLGRQGISNIGSIEMKQSMTFDECDEDDATRTKSKS